MGGTRRLFSRCSAVISDVDGTLVTGDKVLTPRAVAAVAKLRTHGIGFSIISSRPPRGPLVSATSASWAKGTSMLRTVPRIRPKMFSTGWHSIVVTVR